MFEHFEKVCSAIRDIPRDPAVLLFDPILNAYKKGSKIIFVGNGGSACIASHFALDLKKAFYDSCKRFPQAISLASDCPTITMWSNDVGYEYAFLFELQAIAREGDLLILLSSSGNSENIIKCAEWACSSGIISVEAITGKQPGNTLAYILPDAIRINSDETPVIEDCMQVILHETCEYFKTYVEV